MQAKAAAPQGHQDNMESGRQDALGLGAKMISAAPASSLPAPGVPCSRGVPLAVKP